MIYLAQPYSHPDAKVRENRYYDALKVLAWMTLERRQVFSPVVHWHNAAKEFDLPKDAAFWKSYNDYMIGHCDEIAVMLLDGWASSIGTAAEIELGIKLNKRFWIVLPTNKTMWVSTGSQLQELRGNAAHETVSKRGPNA